MGTNTFHDLIRPTSVYLHTLSPTWHLHQTPRPACDALCVSCPSALSAAFAPESPVPAEASVCPAHTCLLSSVGYQPEPAERKWQCSDCLQPCIYRALWRKHGSTLYSKVLDFFSNRSISNFWLLMIFSFSLSLLRWSRRKVSLAFSWPSSCWIMDLSVLAVGENSAQL